MAATKSTDITKSMATTKSMDITTGELIRGCGSLRDGRTW
jgi:hypothetical protein